MQQKGKKTSQPHSEGEKKESSHLEQVLRVGREGPPLRVDLQQRLRLRLRLLALARNGPAQDALVPVFGRFVSFDWKGCTDGWTFLSFFLSFLGCVVRNHNRVIPSRHVMYPTPRTTRSSAAAS